jgi:hypothetical protein
MLSAFERRDFSTIPFAKLISPISSGDPTPIVEFEYYVGQGSIPEGQGFLLALGGLVLNAKNEVIGDTFEICFVVEKISNTKLKVARTLLPGVQGRGHEVGEAVGTLTYGGVAAETMLQIKMLTLEPEIRFLSEILQAIAGGPDVLLIPGLWEEYGSLRLKVVPTEPASKSVLISPGGVFIRDSGTGLTKTLVVRPGTDVTGRNKLDLILPEPAGKQMVLVYIRKDGQLGLFYGEPTKAPEDQPTPVDVAKAPNLFSPLALITLDSLSFNTIQSSQIQDMREWSQQ